MSEQVILGGDAQRREPSRHGVVHGEVEGARRANETPPEPPGSRGQFTAEATNLQEESATDSCAVVDGDGAADTVLPPLSGRGGRKSAAPPAQPVLSAAPRVTAPLTPTQRLLLLDTWQRSGLPAGDFAALVGLSKHTLYDWKRKFEAEGPAGRWHSGEAVMRRPWVI